MKGKPRAIPLLLLVSAILTVLIVVNSEVNAESKHITFTEPVTVGNVVLEPGVYKVVWTGEGPEVLVSFLKVDRTVATAMATLVLQKSPNRRVYEVKVMPDDSRVLKRISFSNESLVFNRSS